MKRIASSLLLGLAVLAARPAPLAAQTITSPYRYIERAQSISLLAGYVLADEGEFGIGPASAPLVGIRYAGRFAPPVAGVVRVTAAPTERTVFARTAGGDAPLAVVGTADAVLLTADAGLRLLLTGPRTWNSLAPFVELTGGLVSTLSSRTEEEGQLPQNQITELGPAFAVNLGVGADWFLTDRFSLGVAATGHLWRQSTPAGLTGTERAASEWTRNLGVTIGTAFHF